MAMMSSITMAAATEPIMPLAKAMPKASDGAHEFKVTPVASRPASRTNNTAGSIAAAKATPFATLSIPAKGDTVTLSAGVPARSSSPIAFGTPPAARFSITA